MAVKTFAAIDLGSYELEMKIFELSEKGGMKQIDDVRHSLDLGSDTYTTKKIPTDKVDELCHILKEFKNIMKTYRVDDYKAYGTSAIRESKNTRILLDQIQQRCGITVEVLSNSEQRFMDYKSIASKTEQFNRMLESDTAILDIGGGSIQLSLFEGGTLTTSQNMRLGILRVQERLQHINAPSRKLENLVEELVSTQLAVFKKMYLKDKTIKNLIIVDDYLSGYLQEYVGANGQKGEVSVTEYLELMEKIRTMNEADMARELHMEEQKAILAAIAAIMVKRVIKVTGAELLWAPGVCLCDGIGYEYAEKHKIFQVEHDFEIDILTSAERISKRYMGSRKRSETLERIALTIFDSMKKIHGLGKRERLLLHIATTLHDCGKYISLVNLGECSYNIIMSTEIIGLSHREREIVANVVKFNHLSFEYYEDLNTMGGISEDDYLIIAKLTAILRVANALDRSHKQKFKDVRTVLKDQQLIINVDTPEDITLEKGLFTHRAAFFEEVYAVKPVIKQKKTV